MKKWKLLSKKQVENETQVFEELLKIRGIEKQNLENFLNPKTSDITLNSIGLKKADFSKFEKRIIKAIDKKEKIVIFGDYDVDGICGTAILWETLYSKTKNVFPYIPDRIDEGYGLSKKGIDNVLSLYPDTKIIITVDNGIVAYEAIDYANSSGLEIIVTDHHQIGKKENNASIILHTTELCGAGIAWILSRELKFESLKNINQKLELAMLATIADLVPLLGANRVIVKEGREVLKGTERVGLQEILKEAKIEKDKIGVYAVGHIIAPRLNASGRIDKAINALRLLCTKDREKAKYFANLLGGVNRERQDLTQEAVNHAKMLTLEMNISPKITIVAHESYNPGVIGIVASQMVESYYRPAFAISIGEEISKGSARSIRGVNIIELLRSVADHLIETGGHPMAAGFSFYTQKREDFFKALALAADEIVTDEILERFINIDLFLPFELITKKLYKEIERIEPFGMGNAEPVFATEGVKVSEIRKIGKESKHLKMKLSKEGQIFDAVGFSLADKYDIDPGDTISIAYTIDENEWKGKKSLQLKIKDIQTIG